VQLYIASDIILQKIYIPIYGGNQAVLLGKNYPNSCQIASEIIVSEYDGSSRRCIRVER